MKVKQINFNWYAEPSYGEHFGSYQVGEYANCLNIEEHRPMGDGDKWFYDVTLNDGTITRIFNINQVFYFPEPKD
jgi:hypothetical protein